MAAALSTVISPSVSKPRKSTRITFTTLRPPPSGTDRSTISPEIGSACRFPEAVMARANTVTPTATSRPPAPHAAQRGAALEPVGEAPQDQDEQHRAQGLDRHLGQGQVGAALHHEQAGHGVTGRPHQQRG